MSLLLMRVPIRRRSKFLVAETALVEFLSAMRRQVLFQRMRFPERFSTQLAFELELDRWGFVLVLDVRRQREFVLRSNSALRTFVDLAVVHAFLVQLESRLGGVKFAALVAFDGVRV